MKTKKTKKQISLFFLYRLSFILLIAAALTGTACGEKESDTEETCIVTVTKYQSPGDQTASEDEGCISLEEYEEMLSLDGVCGGEYFGSSDLTFYDIQYGGQEQASNSSDQTQSYSNRVLSASLLGEKDLNAGRFPETSTEVVFFGEDESLVGKTFYVKIRTGSSGTSNYFVLNYTICGLQNTYPNQIFFSDELCMQVGMMDKRNSKICSAYEERFTADQDSGIWEYAGDPSELFSGNDHIVEPYLYLVIDENLEGLEMRLSSYLLENLAFLDYFRIYYSNQESDSLYQKLYAAFEEKLDAELAKKEAELGELTLTDIYSITLDLYFQYSIEPLGKDEIGEYSIYELPTVDGLKKCLIRSMKIMDQPFLATYQCRMISRDLYQQIYPEEERVSFQCQLTVEDTSLDEVCSALRGEGYLVKTIKIAGQDSIATRRTIQNQE